MKKVIVFVDGGSVGNPGPSAIGVVICNENLEPLKRYSKYLGEGTNNEAEYQAVIFALQKLKALFGKKAVQDLEIQVNSDSELLVKQLTGKYKILDPKIQSLFLKAWNLKIDYDKIRFNLIPREKNEEADRLVKKAIDTEKAIPKLF